MKPYFEKDGIQIFHGNSREILPGLSKVDICLTDPPYGVARDAGFGGKQGFNGQGTPIERRVYNDTWDKERPDPELLKLCLEISKLAIIWGGNYFADLLPQSTHWIVWDKMQTMPSFGDCELAWTNSPRKSVSKVTVEYNGLIGKETYRIHPTQKPLELMTWCLQNYAKEGHTICDPFLGGGTTLVAAKSLNLKAIGIEIEEKYCEIAATRLSNTLLPKSWAGAPPSAPDWWNR